MTMTHKTMPCKYRFGPFTPARYIDYFSPSSSHPMANMEDFEKILVNIVPSESVAAIVIEPIQGEGGFNVPREEFLEYLRKLTDKIQSGIGRTGKFYAIENWGSKTGRPKNRLLGKQPRLFRNA